MPWLDASLAWALTMEDYAFLTGAGNGNPMQIFNPGQQDPGGRRLTPSSARRLPNGQVLIASRTPANEQPVLSAGGIHQHAGADVFLLRASDFMTVRDRIAAGVQGPEVLYNRARLLSSNGIPLHGWMPDRWVQSVHSGTVPNGFKGPNGAQVAPSINWRAADLLNPMGRPTLRSPLPAGNPMALPNSYELNNSYVPQQPSYADVVY